MEHSAFTGTHPPIALIQTWTAQTDPIAPLQLTTIGLY